MKKHVGVFTVLSCSLFAMNSYAADLYVSVGNANASDATSNSGTNPNVPLKSIQRAAALAKAGTTVHVAAGTYNVSAPGLNDNGILSTNSGTASAHIRFVSDPKNRAKIVVSGVGVAWDSKGSYVDIDGFEVTGTGRLGLLIEGGHLSITNNFIHDLTAVQGCNGHGGGAIDTYNGIGDIVISNNIVRNIAAWTIGVNCNTVQGIYIASPNNTVINNIVSGVAAVGIQQWHAATASVIVNNTVFHSAEGISIGQGDAGANGGSANNYVANNLVYDNMKYGIYEFGSVAGNNRYYTNLIINSGVNLQVAGAVSGNVTSKTLSPGFVNYQKEGSGDYHLVSSSPARNAGTATSAPSTDFDGHVRTASDGHVDIGAYEYGSSSTPPPSGAAALFTVSYKNDLFPLNVGCDGSAGISMACNGSIHHYCMNKGYDAGGFGPVEHLGDVAIIGCIKSKNSSGVLIANSFFTTFSALKSNMTSGNTLCSSANPMSTECSSAINRFCHNIGYASGGFGPLEINGDNTEVTCVTSAGAVYRDNSTGQDTWAALQAQDASCSGEAQAPLDVCKSAVTRRCQQLGYLTGYGILEMNTSVAYFSCLLKQ